MTATHSFNVGNIAHGTGALLGFLLGYAIVLPSRRRPIAGCALVLFGFWGSTLGRPLINFSSQGGYEEAEWGYDALSANRDQEAVRWLREAVKYQPKLSALVERAASGERIGSTLLGKLTAIMGPAGGSKQICAKCLTKSRKSASVRRR